jgi:hypothetical protein
VTDSDYFLDYCLWSYRPLAPTAEKWRSSTLLRHSFEVANMGSRVYQLGAAIQRAIDADQTVWGVKWPDRCEEEEGLS